MALVRLDDHGRALAKEPKEADGDVAKAPKNKRKRSYYQNRAPSAPQTQAPKPSSSPTARKENATLAQRIEVLSWHHRNGQNQSITARHFAAVYPGLRIKQPLVSAWLKDEARWRAQWEEARHQRDRTAKRTRRSSTSTGEQDASETAASFSAEAAGSGSGTSIRDGRQQSAEGSSLQVDPGLARAEREVEAALDDLAARGVLQPNNRIDLVSFLEPPGESEFSDSSVVDIYNAVMAAKAARENFDINGGDDVDSDVGPIEPIPTRREVLKGVSTIRRYLDHMNHVVARELDASLYSFTAHLQMEEREKRTRKKTTLTDYFQPLA